MAKNKTILLTDLLVNTENYRFEPMADQKNAIDTMIANQKEKLYNLATHIVQYGLNPNDKVQVVQMSHDKTKYNVLEGNRRTVALKLLANPDLIENTGNAVLKRKFKKLHDDTKNKPRAIECLVYDDPKEAETWIGVKHGYGSSGVGTDGWDPLQKDRFQEKVEGKSSVTIQFINLLKNAPETPNEIKESVSRIDTSNLTRLIGDPEVRDFLGIQITGGVIQSDVIKPEVLKGMIQVAKDLLDDDFKVRNIYSKEDRRNYIKKFPKTQKPDISKKSEKPWQFTNAAPTKPKPEPKPKPQPQDRKYLIPKSCILSINNAKVNAIYHELQSIDIKHKNAIAVLYRVFIELSIDSYMESNKLAALSAAKSGQNLQQKVNIVANHLETTKKADAAICKGIKTAIKDANGLLGIDTWHAYVHNNKFSPEVTHLITTWDNIQEFITILWANVK